MTGHVAVRRQKRRERIRTGHGPEDIRRPGLGPRVLLLAVLACACVLALGAGSAQALLVHTMSFGSAGSGAGQFSSPQGVAADQSSGDVYVVDAGNFRVEKFDASGTFILAFGKGVDHTTGGDICTAASGDTCQAGTQGTSPGEFQGPSFVAVDNSGGPSAGDVYVGDRGGDIVSKFDSSGALITSWGSGGQLSGSGTFASIDGITVDSSGNLLVINDSNSVFQFAQDGSAVTNFPTSRGMAPNGLDVNASGEIFKVNGDTSVERYTSTGTNGVTVAGDSSPNLTATEIAVDRSSGDLYVDAGSFVGHYVFDSSGNVIEPGSTPCTPVEGTGCAPTDTFGTNVLSSGTGVGFDSATTTAYVADAGNNDVAVFGPPSPGPPVIDSQFASPIGNTYATINALVNPFGNDTTCQFQYVDDATFQASGYTNAATVNCTPADLGSTFTDQHASADLTGLTINTTYHFRVVATNSAGTTTGNDTTFTTLGPASIDSESASNVGSTSATLNTQINPLGNDTTCQFQYVDDATFQASAYTNATTVNCTPSDLGAGKIDVSASADISGLTPNTTYHFRAVATNTLGTELGSDQTFTTAPPALITSEFASNVASTSATLNAQINPEGNDTTCNFQYVDDATFQASGYTNATTVACTPPDLGSGTSDVSVSTDISGLTPSTTYHFRAVATNTLGTANGDDTTFATTPPVVIDSESATHVTDSSATLTAQVNPEGLDTTCQFQYVDEATFQASGFTNALVAPAKPVDVGSGTSDVATSVDLTGLQPSTKYHFRVVCKNAAGTAAGPDRTFKTFASGLPTGLPDNRGYEMVTPPNKDNGEPFLRSGPFGPLQAANDGNKLSWVSLDALPGSAFDGSFYLSNRGSSSWLSQNLIPPQATELGLLCALASPEMFAFTADLSKGILADGGSLIGTCGADVPPLVPGEPRGAQNLFVRNNANGTYQLVDVTPSGVTPANATYDASSADMSHVVFDESAQLTSNAPAGADNLYEWSGGSVRLVTLLPGETPVVGSLAGGAAGSAFHAVSDDGARIFFTANGNLYERENGSTTAQIDASQGSGPGGGGQFLAATADGLTVFFTDDASAGLTSDTVPGSGANLYRYSNGHLTDLTPVSDAQVAGLSGITGDGSYLYFVAFGSLASGATAGQPNVYLLHNGTLTFIATLSGNDGCDWSSTSLCARVSSNGTFLAFTSTNGLTGYDNNGQPEIFRYDASANNVACASCIPSGVPASGGARVNSPYTPLLSSSSEYLQRYVSDSGQVFFDTPDSLTPRDTNGQQDVYEYENGQVRLISGGTSVDPSWFIDTSPSGSDVFFGTSQQLVAQDTDGAMDFYDARVGGGFPASAPPPACVGEGCKPPQSGTPGVPVVASVTFFGPGNVKGKHVARVVVLRKTVKGTTIRLRIRVPGAGQITISGRGLQTVSRSVRHAGVFTLTMHLTAKARAKLRHRHRLRLTISVRFVPAGAGGSTAKIKLTVKA